MKVSALAQMGLLHVLPATAEYVWPSKYDELEDLMVLQTGAGRRGVIDGINPCTFTQGGPETQASAEWIRIAFHDMATFDKETGIGGLDGSIQFESDRPENAGAKDFVNGTLGFFTNYYSARASAADLIALAMVLAIGNCEGPKIPFRVGRIDAKEAGATGVPEPQQPLDMHKKMFAKAGFNTEEMIAMVACGHTMGGVHGKTFPEITGSSNSTNVIHFDTTTPKFDAKVATEWIDGTTSNPLVHAQNDTFSSDKRIFSADNNVTMAALASDTTTFNKMCTDILARMIDTVPASVTLSEPLAPTPLKPYIDDFSLLNATHIHLAGRIRLLTSLDRYEDEIVTLSYAPRDAPAGNVKLNTTISTTGETYQGGTVGGVFGELMKWYDFDVVVPAATSIKAFNVTVTRGSTGEETVFDNAGRGFPLDDSLMLQRAQSCRADTFDVTLVAAVRSEVLEGGKGPVVAEVSVKGPSERTALGELTDEVWEGDVGVVMGEWTLVTMKKTMKSGTLDSSFDLVAGEKRVDFVRMNALGETCGSF